MVYDYGRTYTHTLSHGKPKTECFQQLIAGGVLHRRGVKILTRDYPIHATLPFDHDPPHPANLSSTAALRRYNGGQPPPPSSAQTPNFQSVNV